MNALGTDWVGISTVIAAAGSAVAAVIGAVISGKIHGQVSTSGDPRTLGQLSSDVAAKIAPTRDPSGDH